jgi:Flp pilus assembly protein TadD
MLRALLSASVWLVAVSLLCQRVLLAADQAWELRGEVKAVGSDASRLVELRLPDGSTVRVPLVAFSERSQAGIMSLAEGAKPTAKEAEAGSSIGAIEEAVARCRTAEEAVRALKLCLAGGEAGLPDADAVAAIGRWEARASRGEVRLGREWVTPDVAAAAAKAGEQLLTEVATMARLGNLKSLKDYLEKASRADPSSGRADFLLGLATAFGVGQRTDFDKAQRLFAEVVAREPGNGAAWNNLAVCEVVGRRFDDALGHFTKAVEHLENPQVVASNVALVVAGASDRRSKLTAKQTEGFAALYRRLVPDQSGAGQVPPSLAGPTLLSPFGQPVAAQSNFADLLLPPAGIMVERRGVGVVVAPKVVLASATVPFQGGSVVIRLAGGTGVEFPAELLATSQGLGVALLRCEQLTTEPVPLAASVPAVGSQVMAVPPPGRSRGGTGLAARPAAVVALNPLPGLFVHTAPLAGGLVGAPIVDAGGRVVGLTASTPEVSLPGPPRAFGAAIERIWPFLKDHLPDLEPAESAESAGAWEAIVGGVSGRVVDVVARPAP